MRELNNKHGLWKVITIKSPRLSSNYSNNRNSEDETGASGLFAYALPAQE